MEWDGCDGGELGDVPFGEIEAFVGPGGGGAGVAVSGVPEEICKKGEWW